MGLFRPVAGQLCFALILKTSQEGTACETWMKWRKTIIEFTRKYPRMILNTSETTIIMIAIP
jgi:hypothetical protein